MSLPFQPAPAQSHSDRSRNSHLLLAVPSYNSLSAESTPYYLTVTIYREQHATMPRKRRAEDPERAQRLSLAELAAHDDVCSDALIDNVSNPLTP